MKIVSQINTEIIISSPRKSFVQISFNLFFLLVRFLFFGGGMIIASFIGARDITVIKVTCDRVEPRQIDCQITPSNFLGLISQKPQEYKFVQGAKEDILTRKDSDGDIVNDYRFLFLIKFGEKQPFKITPVPTYSNLAQSINTFVASKQNSFRYTVDNRRNENNIGIYSIILITTLMILFSPLLLCVGVGEVFAYEEVRLSNKLQHSKREIFVTKVNEYEFVDIVNIDLKYAVDSYKNISYIPRITTHSGVQFRLDEMSDRNAAIKLVNNLNRFIGLPEEEDPVVKE